MDDDFSPVLKYPTYILHPFKQFYLNLSVDLSFCVHQIFTFIYFIHLECQYCYLRKNNFSYFIIQVCGSDVATYIVLHNPIMFQNHQFFVVISFLYLKGAASSLFKVCFEKLRTTIF